MRTPGNYFDEIFDFKGSWDIPSKCGLKRFEHAGKKPVVIVTELYRDNPGSSITSVVVSLARQVADHYHYQLREMIYIECNPDMNSKLSFYDEEFFLVTFEYLNDQPTKPEWRKISIKELKEFIAEE
jgi:hypothetical protein